MWEDHAASAQTPAPNLLLSWSGGKDSALALHALQSERASARVTALLTTVTEGYERVSMHGVRRELLARQAAALGLPVEVVHIPQDSSNREYEDRMRAVLVRQQRDGVSGVAFGDLFLEDVRAYRERRLAEVGLEAHFPLWGQETSGLANRFLTLGFQAVVVCVDTQVLEASFAGRAYDQEFLAELPEGVDACGENGEFHTFAHTGPIFREPIPVRVGAVVIRDKRFAFCDLLPGES